MKPAGYVISFFLCLAQIDAISQVAIYLPDTSIKVYAYGQERTLAWCGGFDNPQFAMADLNNDGLADLVVYEPYNSLRTFINRGTAGSPLYVYTPEYELNFPPIQNYIIMADYNCDGIPDLFHRGFQGFSVYKGYYNSLNQLCFTYYKDLYYPSPYGPIPASVEYGSIPAIADVDNDGDLDFIAYSAGRGGTMFRYKNMQAEMGLSCDSIVIEVEDQCWGRIYQPFTNRTVDMLDGDCLVLPGTSYTSGPSMNNTICLFDYDMDGDYDYLGGTQNWNTMTFLLNDRIPYSGNDSLVQIDSTWQSGGKMINIARWPAAFNVDVDQDGKKDLLVAPNYGAASENYNCIWYYKNNTIPGVTDWQFQSDSFLIDQTIDIGSATYPVLYDYNKDGLPDLFVGSDGYYQESSGTLRSRISYYENTSTPGNPSFTLQTTDLLQIDSFNFQGAAPAMGDLDNDGKDDLIIGHTDGTLSYFRNVAASNSLPPVWQLVELMMTDMYGDTIHVGGYAAPFLYDVDKDGKKDLVTGNIFGTLNYYQNVGTITGVVTLKPISADLGKVMVDSLVSYPSNSVPFIGPVDSTGTDYLLVGSMSGNLYRYSGIASGDTSIAYTMLDPQYSFIDSIYNDYYDQGAPYGIYGNLRSTVTIGDVAGDGSLYMIVGNNKGGLELYKQGYVYPTSAVPSVNKTEHSKVALYPNPTNDLLTITWSGVTAPNVQINVINMEGQQLYATSAPSAANHAAIPVSALPDGMYVCVLQSGVNRYYSKFTVVH